MSNKIAGELKRLDATNQEKFDEALIALDGTENKSKLGANAMLGFRWPSPRRLPLQRSSHCSAMSAGKARMCCPFP